MKLKYDKLPSSFAFTFNLRRYTQVDPGVDAKSQTMPFGTFLDKLAATVAASGEGANGGGDGGGGGGGGGDGGGGGGKYSERVELSEISEEDYEMRCNTTVEAGIFARHVIGHRLNQKTRIPNACR